MTTERELSEAFAPCTLGGLADEWASLNKEIGVLQGRRDHLGAILLGASAMDHDGAVEHLRFGALIEGQTVKIRAIWRLTDGAPHPKWAPKLEYVR